MMYFDGQSLKREVMFLILFQMYNTLELWNNMKKSFLETDDFLLWKDSDSSG